MSENYEAFAIADLDTITFVCPACKTEVMFPLSTPTTFGAPCACPTCREVYPDEGILFAAYRELFSRAAAIKKGIRLRAARAAE
jgi:hypothetical protein